MNPHPNALPQRRLCSRHLGDLVGASSTVDYDPGRANTNFRLTPAIPAVAARAWSSTRGADPAFRQQRRSRHQCHHHLQHGGQSAHQSRRCVPRPRTAPRSAWPPAPAPTPPARRNRGHAHLRGPGIDQRNQWYAAGQYELTIDGSRITDVRGPRCLVTPPTRPAATWSMATTQPFFRRPRRQRPDRRHGDGQPVWTACHLRRRVRGLRGGEAQAARRGPGRA